MTYGENTNLLRLALTQLLHQHRVQQRLGGPRLSFPETTTVEQRRALGEQIARYRHGVLTWCLEAVDAVHRRLDPRAPYDRSSGPVDELRHRLRGAHLHSTAGLPTMAELTTAHDIAMLEHWRQAARAASLGEHDLVTGPRQVPLTKTQCDTLISDVAAITEAVALLDRRYKNIPGWEHLHGRGRLATAAANCADFSVQDDLDYTVDLTGWRPPTRRIEGPPRPGLSGVLQAQHNLVVALAEFPNGLNLRRIFRSQQLLSAKAADLGHAVQPDLAENWVRRTATYTALVDGTRNLGGLIGRGGQAAADSANAVSRLALLPRVRATDRPALRRLDALFARTDTRLAQVVEHGAHKELYLARERLPELAHRADKGIIPVRAEYVPIRGPLTNDILSIIRERLRPAPSDLRPPGEGRVSRRDLASALEAQPRSTLPRYRGPGTDIAPPLQS